VTTAEEVDGLLVIVDERVVVIVEEPVTVLNEEPMTVLDEVVALLDTESVTVFDDEAVAVIEEVCTFDEAGFPALVDVPELWELIAGYDLLLLRKQALDD
jgi:hypothetical protein